MNRIALLLFLVLSALLSTACASSSAGDPAGQTTPPPISNRAVSAVRAEPPVRGAMPTLDVSCRTNDDCAVKNVGNCCGAMPACVNKDSPTDPAAVQAQCAREGRMSVCGFREISSCRCNAGRCEPSQASREKTLIPLESKEPVQ